MKQVGTTLALILTAAILPMAAQGQVVLKGAEITESALIDALTPGPRTRNLARDPQTAAASNPAAAVLITFETNSTELTSQAKKDLDVVGRTLRSNRLSEFAFLLEGHADPRGTAEHNQSLSEGRARAVLHYLVQNHRIEQARLRAIGKGDREPMNRSDPAAEVNRRVQIVTMPN